MIGLALKIFTGSTARYATIVLLSAGLVTGAYVYMERRCASQIEIQRLEDFKDSQDAVQKALNRTREIEAQIRQSDDVGFCHVCLDVIRMQSSPRNIK